MTGIKNVGVTYRGGVLSKVVVYDPVEATITDCRIREYGEPFVTVAISDGEVSVSAYLPLDIAEQLGRGLVALFAEPDQEHSPQVDFPAAVDPVERVIEAMERGE